MKEQISTAAPSSMKTNVIFALSELATNPIATITMAFLIYFYTDIVGLNPAIVGTVILASKAMDGISDLIGGNIVDHTHAKTGKARPWYLRLAIPMALAYIMLFTVPDWSTGGKVAYIFISYNLSSTVIYTMFNAAMAAFPIFLTKNRESRSAMSTMRLFVACATQIVLMIFGLKFVEMLGGDQTAWIKFAAILGVFAALVMVFVYFNTKEISTENDENVENAENIPFWTAIRALLHNKYWFIILVAFFIGVIIQVCTLTDGVYYAKYVLNDIDMQANLTMYFLVPNLIPLALLPYCFKYISKQKLCIIGAVFLLVGTAIGVILPTGAGFIVGLALRGIGYGINAGCQPAMVIDAVVYGEWKTGYNIPGITTTATCAAQKLGSGIGTALLGLVLGWFGYNGMAEVQPPMAVSAINVTYMIVPAILSIVWIVLFQFYKLDKEYPKYVKELEERHAQKAKE